LQAYINKDWYKWGTKFNKKDFFVSLIKTSHRANIKAETLSKILNIKYNCDLYIVKIIHVWDQCVHAFFKHKNRRLVNTVWLLLNITILVIAVSRPAASYYPKGQYSYFRLLNIKNAFQHYIVSSLHQCIYMMYMPFLNTKTEDL
jgi:hypothetical protein